MDPQVRSCTTSDGLSIGYWSIGGGETIIDAGQPPTHCEMEWRLAPMPRRGRRVEEQIEVLRKLWTQPLVTYKSAERVIDNAGFKSPKKRMEEIRAFREVLR